MQLENLIIGHNIAKYRKLKDLKASDIATQLGIKEATYTKYERGETAITIDFVQKVADILHIDPLQIICTSPTNFLESIANSSFTFQGNSVYQSSNETQNASILKLMESMINLNERIVTLLETR